MGKNLIRNGGFERGTTDFWTPYDYKSFGVVGTPVYKGSYAGSIVCDGVHEPFLMPSDYISIAEGEMMVFQGFFRKSTGAGATTAKIYAVYYDEGLDVIDEEYYGEVNLHDSVYDPFLLVISGCQAATYIKIRVSFADSSLDEALLIDNVSLRSIDVNKIAGVTKRLMDRDSYTSFGFHYSDKFVAVEYKEVVLSLRCTSISPVAGRADIKLQSWDRGGNTWIDIATFAQIAAAINEQVLVVTAGIGEIVRVSEELSGATTTISYKLTGMFKR